MKNMTTREMCAVAVKISEPLSKIVEDDSFTAAVKAASAAMEENIPVSRFLATISAWAIPFLLEKHESETFEILAAVTGKTAEEVLEQPASVTISELKNLFKDAA